MTRTVTVYRKPVLERRTNLDGRLSEYESTWRRTKMLEARDVVLRGVYWPRVHLDFGGVAGIREFSLRSGRGIGNMRDWVLRPEDCRALRVEHAPQNRKKRRELGRENQASIRPGGREDESALQASGAAERGKFL